jgi:hypothetical protein
LGWNVDLAEAANRFNGFDGLLAAERGQPHTPQTARPARLRSCLTNLLPQNEHGCGVNPFRVL